METRVDILGKSVQVRLSRSADAQLRALTAPLIVELELYFSCLLRKKVRFRADAVGITVAVTDRLQLSFHPVMTRACGKDYEGDEPPKTDFPITNPRPYVPHWVEIDFTGGEWRGDFGYQ